jgi:hypothetical protein
VKGTLITESLRVGTSLRPIRGLVVTEIRRYAVNDVPECQAPVWTALEFEGDDGSAEELATSLASSLDEPGWYANFSTSEETFVVYPKRTFRYPRLDQQGREGAQAYGRALGVPEPQFDWSE